MAKADDEAALPYVLPEFNRRTDSEKAGKRRGSSAALPRSAGEALRAGPYILGTSYCDVCCHDA